jgi:hypothetical protein
MNTLQKQQFAPVSRKNKGKLIVNVISIITLAITLCIAGYIGSYALSGHPPVIGLIYKEYPDVAQAYKSIKLGDRIKVTITVTASKPVNGIVQVGADSYHGIAFRFSPYNKTNLQLSVGKNIVYGFISEKLGTAFYCDIEDVQV